MTHGMVGHWSSRTAMMFEAAPAPGRASQALHKVGWVTGLPGRRTPVRANFKKWRSATRAAWCRCRTA
jgi:hypothetical protein